MRPETYAGSVQVNTWLKPKERTWLSASIRDSGMAVRVCKVHSVTQDPTASLDSLDPDDVDGRQVAHMAAQTASCYLTLSDVSQCSCTCQKQGV
jgi:hypothetical protein